MEAVRLTDPGAWNPTLVTYCWGRGPAPLATLPALSPAQMYARLPGLWDHRWEVFGETALDCRWGDADPSLSYSISTFLYSHRWSEMVPQAERVMVGSSCEGWWGSRQDPPSPWGARTHRVQVGERGTFSRRGLLWAERLPKERHRACRRLGVRGGVRGLLPMASRCSLSRRDVDGPRPKAMATWQDGDVRRWRCEEMVAARTGSRFSGTFTDVAQFPPKAGLTPCPFSSRYAPPPFRKG